MILDVEPRIFALCCNSSLKFILFHFVSFYLIQSLTVQPRLLTRILPPLSLHNAEITALTTTPGPRFFFFLRLSFSS